jgi:hypothetical protein
MNFVRQPVEPAERKYAPKSPSCAGRERLQSQEREQPILEEVIDSIGAGQLDERHPWGKRAIRKPEDQRGVAEKERPPEDGSAVQGKPRP